MTGRCNFFVILTLTLAVGHDALAQAPRGLPGQSSTLLPDGRWLMIGGESPGNLSAMLSAWDPVTNQFSSVPAQLNYPRAWHTATLLADGTVLILGGIGKGGGIVDSAELFDPSTNILTVLPPTGLIPRAWHTVTLLTDGHILVAGGIVDGGDTLGQAQIWDPDLGIAVTLPGGLAIPRSHQTATLLPDGLVLLWGGLDAGAVAISSGELFDPDSQHFNITATPAHPPGAQDQIPRLAFSLPGNGSSSVLVESRIALRFSKALKVDTVNPSTVSLTGPEGPVAMKVVPAGNGLLAFAIPLQPLAGLTTYTLKLAGPADRSSGLPESAINFTTGDSQDFEEDWNPRSDDPRNGWLTGRPASPWQSLPALKATPGVTAIAGQVLRLNGRPLPGVTLRIEDTETSATTDRSGRFLLRPLSSGHHVLLIDGRSADSTGTAYGVFEAGVEVTGGSTTTLPYTIWMPKSDVAHAVKIASPTAGEVVIRNPSIPGVELHLPPNTIIRDHDGKVVTQISLTPVPLDRTPFPLPNGARASLYFTIQPGAGSVEVRNSTGPQGATLVYPGTPHTAPRSRHSFWTYDPDGKGWYISGRGTVAPDGKKVTPNPAVTIGKFRGDMIADPGQAPGNGPNPGNPDACGGDPVDLVTGLLIDCRTDLALPDLMPITLKRTYRPGDSMSRAFGIGSTQLYDMFLIGDTFPWTYTELVLPDGSRIHFNRTSPGTSFSDAVYQNTTSQTFFFGSTMAWNGNGWDMRLKSGTVLSFQDGFGAAMPTQAALIAISDRYGNAIQLTRDSSFNLIGIASPNGRWIHLAYDSNNRITQATDNIGRTVTYTYDAKGHLATMTDPNGGKTSYTYDNSDQMLTVTDPRGIVALTHQYDGRGRVVKQTLGDGTSYQFAYVTDSQGNITETDVTDPRGILRKVVFNSDGYIVSDTHAAGLPEQWALQYQWQTGTNLLSTFTDALGRQSQNVYDAMGNLTTATRLVNTPSAVTTTFTYEPKFNRVTSITDALGHTTRFTYDDNGDMTSATDPLGQQSTIAYNGAGQPVSITDPLGNTTKLTYSAGDLVEITDPLGNTVTRVVDGVGRTIARTDPLGNATSYAYDPLDDLTQMLDAVQNVTKFVYDPNKNLLSVTDALNNVTQYAYDKRNRLLSRADPLSRTETLQYDAAGNLAQFTDRRGQTIARTFNGLNQPLTAAFGPAANPESTISYSYDQGNRLISAVDSLTGAITRAYDNLGHLISETTPQGAVTYTYDPIGRRTGMTAAGQTSVSYAYDDDSRLTNVTQGPATVNLQYDAANRRTSLTLPNGVTINYSYDPDSRITGLTYTGASGPLGTLTYTYDEAGRRTSVSNSISSSVLPQATASAGYDAANELTSWNTAALTYDANGNLINDGNNTYTWNARNQLVQIAQGGAPVASFMYDAFGRRAVKMTGAGSTSFLYDGPNVVQEIGGSGANLLTGLNTDEIFSRTDQTGTYSFLRDAIGSTIALTGPDGNIQTQYAYGAFGSSASTGSANTNSFEYTGRENDGTGLYEYRARYYSPAFQRFISQDPIGLSGGANFYAYAASDPVSKTDPMGLCPNDCVQQYLTNHYGSFVANFLVPNFSLFNYLPGSGGAAGAWEEAAIAVAIKGGGLKGLIQLGQWILSPSGELFYVTFLEETGLTAASYAALGTGLISVASTVLAVAAAAAIAGAAVATMLDGIAMAACNPSGGGVPYTGDPYPGYW